MLRAAVKDIGKIVTGRRPKAPRRISQQVARNCPAQFRRENRAQNPRSDPGNCVLMRPIRKKKVLELYLNEINLGQNSYGVAAAALNYFDKSLTILDIAEVAFLASLPKAPSHYDPRFHHRRRLTRPLGDTGRWRKTCYVNRSSRAKAAMSSL